jgi:hypothetical protein
MPKKFISDQLFELVDESTRVNSIEEIEKHLFNFAMWAYNNDLKFKVILSNSLKDTEIKSREVK